MFTLPNSLLSRAPMHHKLKPQPPIVEPRVKVSQRGGFACDVTLVYARAYYMTIGDVYLSDGDWLLVSLKPAIGQVKRSPSEFVAVVVSVAEGKARAFRTVRLSKGEMLTVCL